VGASAQKQSSAGTLVWRDGPRVGQPERGEPFQHIVVPLAVGRVQLGRDVEVAGEYHRPLWANPLPRPVNSEAPGTLEERGHLAVALMACEYA
jgi:hypothetical protein